jgi:hypothetical protein
MPNTCPRIIVVDGIQYIYDVTRNKILSAARLYLRAGAKFHTVDTRMLRVEDGMPTGLVGDAMPRPATITGVSAHCASAATWHLKIYKKGTALEIVDLFIDGSAFAADNSLNMDLTTGDVLLFKLEGAGVPYPRALLELAWRL